jgi:hypothetical protein
MRITPVLAVLCVAGTAAAQSPLYGVSFFGQLFTINTVTGAATLVAATGFDRLNAAAMNCAGDIYASRSRNPTLPTDPNRLIKINPATGAGTLVWDWGTANDLRGLAFGDNDVLYALRDNGTPDSLVTIDLSTGVVTEVGATGRGDLQGLTAAPGGRLLAVGVSPSGAVYDVNPATGTATLIGGSGADSQAVEFAFGTTVWVARVNLATVDLTTGTTTVVGPTGQSDLRGLAGFRPTCGPAPCYANCDGSSGNPLLTANDFQCFINKFAASDTYANCDGSTGNPLLTANDFQCFINKYAGGCS